MELKFHGVRPAVLADGRIGTARLYRANVRWDGKIKKVEAISTEGDPLVGMSLLRGFRLTMDVDENGMVQIEKLDK